MFSLLIPILSCLYFQSLLNHSRSVIKMQSSKIDEMETSLFHLNQNINSLKEKVSVSILYILVSVHGLLIKVCVY